MPMNTTLVTRAQGSWQVRHFRERGRPPLIEPVGNLPAAITRLAEALRERLEFVQRHALEFNDLLGLRHTVTRFRAPPRAPEASVGGFRLLAASPHRRDKEAVRPLPVWQ